MPERKVGWLLEFYIQATSKVASGDGVLTCYSTHSLRLYGAAPLGNQAAGTMT